MQHVVGVVKSVQADEVWVQVGKAGCGRCDEPGGCGGVSIAQSLCGKEKQYRFVDNLGLKPGENVIVGIPSGALVRSVNYSYTLPLFLVMCFAGVGASYYQRDPTLGGVVGVVVGLFVAWLVLRRAIKTGVTAPVIIGRPDVSAEQ